MFIISLIISLCIFMIFDISANEAIKMYEKLKNKTVNAIENNDEDNHREIMKENNSKETKSEVTKEEVKEDIWQIEIPKIKLVAPISDGTSQEVMLEYVGHFENTSIWNSNVGLAAHNRGYPINYFSKLKDLKKGDKIVYKTKYGMKTYSVDNITVIEDTDWSYLQKTKENRITLITCIANKPSQRLCVQGIEIKEE